MSLPAERPKFNNFKQEVAWGMDVSPTSRRQRQAYIILERGLRRLGVVRERVDGMLEAGLDGLRDWSGNVVLDLGQQTTLTIREERLGSDTLDRNHFAIDRTVRSSHGYHDYGVWVGRDYCQITDDWRDDSGGSSEPYWPRELLDAHPIFGEQAGALKHFDTNMARAYTFVTGQVVERLAEEA